MVVDIDVVIVMLVNGLISFDWIWFFGFVDILSVGLFVIVCWICVEILIFCYLSVLLWVCFFNIVLDSW